MDFIEGKLPVKARKRAFPCDFFIPKTAFVKLYSFPQSQKRKISENMIWKMRFKEKWRKKERKREKIGCRLKIRRFLT